MQNVVNLFRSAFQHEPQSEKEKDRVLEIVKEAHLNTRKKYKQRENEMSK